MASMVVTWWIVAFLPSVLRMFSGLFKRFSIREREDERKN